MRMIKLVGVIARAKETTSSGDETDYADVFPVLCLCNIKNWRV